MHTLSSTLISFLIFLFTVSLTNAELIDSTKQLQFLGNPYQKRYPTVDQWYARNIWDMQVYDNKIFLGAGNSSNHGPASNAGPVPIMFFDSGLNAFFEDGEVDEEQIDSFVVLNNKLVIPGHDPREDWSMGNFYQRQNNSSWKKYRNIPEALHNYAMTEQNNTLFAGLGLKNSGAVAVSQDQGNSWELISTTNARVYSFLAVKDKVYATNALKAGNTTPMLYEYQGKAGFVAREDITPALLFPGKTLDPQKNLKIIRGKALVNAAIYIGAYTHNDHQSQPFGVFVANALSAGQLDIKALDLPDAVIPWDVLILGQEVYILASVKDLYHKPVLNTVYHASIANLPHVEPLLQFSAASFARSFAFSKNAFYFALGTEITQVKEWDQAELNEHAGDVLKLNQSLH